MAKQSYAEIIANTKLMTQAMESNKTNLSVKLDDNFISQLKINTAEAEKINVLQEKLKADLKEQTAKLNAVIKDIKKQYSEAKKRIKLDFEKERWKEFGIEDKR